MKHEDRIKPRLGKMRSTGDAKSRRLIGKIVRATTKAGGNTSGFVKARTGMAKVNAHTLIRGTGQGGGARYRSRIAGQRRVVIKARIVRLSGRGVGAMKAHLSYIERDGVTRAGDRGQMYGRDGDTADAKNFAATCEQDRHQFRFIVAPEDGHRLEDMKPFVRDLMADMEKDLGTRLDWVAVDHYNTGHPHSHIVVRGKTDRGDDLVIARDYIGHGIRARAAELLTIELGPKTDIEQVQDWRREINPERFTGLDRELVRRAVDGEVDLASKQVDLMARIRADLLVQRLRVLEALGLAKETAARRWQLDANLESTLRAMGERGDIIKTMNRALVAQGLERHPDQLMTTPNPNTPTITGKLIERGLADEHRDRHHLIIDGIDGRTHYVNIGDAKIDASIKPDAIIEITPPAQQATPEQALQVRTLSTWSLDAQASANAPTWLDKRLVEGGDDIASGIASNGFGGAVREALNRRRQWLLAQDLIKNIEAPVPTMIFTALKQRELARAANALAKETGMDVSVAQPGDRIVGTVIKRLALASGPHAVIDQGARGGRDLGLGRGLVIAPWSSTLARAKDNPISGIVMDDGVRWTIGRNRGMGI